MTSSLIIVTTPLLPHKMKMGKNKDFRIKYTPIETIPTSNGSLKMIVAIPIKKPIRWEKVKNKILPVVINTELVAFESEKYR